MLLNGKEQVHFWQELERVERWLSTGAGAAVGRVYDSMGRPGEQTFAHYGNQLVAAGARVDRVREALDQSAPIAKRLVMQQLSGIGLSAVWDILIAACKEIALYYGGAVVTGAVVGGALGSLAFGVGAAPGAVLGTAAGSQVGIWVLALLGLKELAEGLGKMFPAAMEHYERGFREAWGAMPENRRETWNSPGLPTGNASAGAWQMAQGHVILVTAILTALVAYLTRGRGNKAVLMQDIRNSPRLGPKFADWLAENEGRLLAQPQLQSRPNNSVAMAVEKSLPSSGRGGADVRGASRVQNDGPNNLALKQTGSGTFTGTADELYDAIRGNNADVLAIASNTGIKAKNIQKVKDHVFFNEHLLDRYVDYGIPAEMRQFDSSLSQGEAWLRLEKGTHTREDIQWLKHETAERWFEMKYNSGYSKAHNAAEKHWPGDPWGF